MLVVYNVYIRDSTSASQRQVGSGDFGYGAAATEALWSMYLGDGRCTDDPRAAPLLAPLGNLLSANIVAGGLDPLRDDRRRLVACRIEVGCRFECVEYPGVVHGFKSITCELAVARHVTARMAGTRRRALRVAEVAAATRRLVGDHMFPLTIRGVDQAIGALLSSH